MPIEGIGGPKIALSTINGVNSMTVNGQTTFQPTAEITNPEGEITNSIVEITNPEGETTNPNVEITNPNNQTLTWLSTINYTPGEPGGWLQLSPDTGQLNANETSNPPITVNVNTANLAPGKTYTAKVVFSWQADGDTLEIRLTV